MSLPRDDRIILIDFDRGAIRASGNWKRSNLQRLRRSLLKLKGLQLVVSDAHSGIRAALDRHFQGVAWQRCRVHFKREMGRKVSYQRLKELMKDIAVV